MGDDKDWILSRGVSLRHYGTCDFDDLELMFPQAPSVDE